MFSASDLKQINERGSDIQVVKRQIEHFKRGFPYLKLEKAATPSDGIIALDQNEILQMVNTYDQQTAKKQIVKFVPASGAASRMFKLLFEFLEICNHPQRVSEELDKSDDLQSIRTFFDRVSDFAFAKELDSHLQRIGSSLQSCMEKKDYSALLHGLLGERGLGYGNSPKGLLKFHKYAHEARTPVMEHLVEGALYAQSDNQLVRIHFTVSPEHKAQFRRHIEDVIPELEATYAVKYEVSFSEQKSYTDTIAVDLENRPFRDEAGKLLFRPAGHGALIANLNEIEADIVFIKNIDNVVPDDMKKDTVSYKKVLAGVLLNYQEKIFDYMNRLEKESSPEIINEIMIFLEEDLKLRNIPQFNTAKETVDFLARKLNRPIRVCGMVRNEGEPGGGPFYVKNSDGTQSLQIVESSQIDVSDHQQKKIAHGATHFNPVDLVCGISNYRGEKFDLAKYVDPSTGFISQKSKNGLELKAQELPGLWNGSMSDWNTLFVEVPISTFNPVKTVNDLLRPQHQ